MNPDSDFDIKGKSMTQMKYKKRYNAALKLFENFQKKANGMGTIFYDGAKAFDQNPFYRINEDGDIIVRIDDMSSACLFMNNVDYDEGMHTTIKDYATNFHNTFEIWKRIG